MAWSQCSSHCFLQGVLEEVSLLQEITEACRGAVRAFVEDRTDSKGRVSQDSLNNFARSIGFGQQPWTKSLKVTTCIGLLHLWSVLSLLQGIAT